MNPASLHDIRKELAAQPPERLAELCLSLARYKKDNKEMLTYLLFEAHDRAAFLKEIREEIDMNFQELRAQPSLYYTKKSLRKILRMITRYARYVGDHAFTAGLLIHFCLRLKASGIPFRQSQQLINMYEQQLKKIHTLVKSLHEDLRGDYTADLEEIENY
jgi:hypothetical protein